MTEPVAVTWNKYRSSRKWGRVDWWRAISFSEDNAAFIFTVVNYVEDVQIKFYLTINSLASNLRKESQFFLQTGISWIIENLITLPDLDITSRCNRYQEVNFYYQPINKQTNQLYNKFSFSTYTWNYSHKFRLFLIAIIAPWIRVWH